MKNICAKDELIFLKNPSNLYYFSSINNPDAYILMTEENKYYFTDDRYMEYAEKTLKNKFIIKQTTELYSVLEKLIKDYPEVGIEDDLPYIYYERIVIKGAKKFNSVTPKIQLLRTVKTPEEIETIKKAQAITDAVFSKILHEVKEGMTERELACILESNLFLNGADELAFRSIVAFDENSSIPHAERSDKKLKNGSIITLDFGAKFNNYCSDMTRTFFFGKPDDEKIKIYQTVLDAQKFAIDHSFVGMTAKECDALARDYFAKRNLDRFFLHSLGHGVGIDIHEYPGVSSRSDAVLLENMLITIEPGLYFAGKFGIRIEDMIIFDKTSVINLTKSPKNIIII